MAWNLFEHVLVRIVSGITDLLSATFNGYEHACKLRRDGRKFIDQQIPMKAIYFRWCVRLPPTSFIHCVVEPIVFRLYKKKKNTQKSTDPSVRFQKIIIQQLFIAKCIWFCKLDENITSGVTVCWHQLMNIPFFGTSRPIPILI